MSQVVQSEGRERLTRVIAVASLVASFTYLAWRWGWTLDRESLWFSLPLVLAETYGVIAAALLTVTAWRLRVRAPMPPLPGRTVDVFVTAAFEPIAIIRKTALAARQISYPHTTWLLDDGHRDEVRTVAEEIGIRYLRRDAREHAKAGNLNHAMQHATGEFILQLDADHVPLPQIIDRLIGFFEDERVAVTQSPQDFYNTDAFTGDAGGRGRQLWGDQQLFFNVLQPGKDRANAAMFVGSCAMLRRAALDDVGGFAPHTAVMGTETSLRLHAAGWRTVYLNENLAFGLAPSTAHLYQVQQLHRAQGAMHALRRYQPLALPGLSLLQRAMYLETLTSPLGGVQRLILYLAPIVFLTTGTFPLRASVGAFAGFFLPAVLLRAASFRLLTRGQGSLLHTDRYWMAKFFTHVIALRAYVTRRAMSYRPRRDQAGTVPLRTVAPQLALIAVTAVSLAWAIYAQSIGYGTEVPGWGPIALYGAVLLALWHAGLAGHVTQLSLAGRHRRAEHRFAESLSVTLRVLREDGKLSSTDIAMTEDLTATGLALRGMYPIPEGARVEMLLPLSGGEAKVRGRVVRHSTAATELGTVHLAGVEFDTISRETRDAIELHCAQHAMPIEQQRHRQAALLTGALGRLRDPRASRRVAIGMPARVMTGTGAEAVEVGVGLLEDVSPRGGRVVLDSPVAEGTDLTLHIPGSAARVSGRVVFVHALQTGVGMRFVAGFETEMPPVPPGAADVPAPWYGSIVQLANRYGSSVTEGSRAAAESLSTGSRTAVERLSVGSRDAADALARSSRATVQAVTVGSQAALETVAATSRAAADSVASTSRAAADSVTATSRAAVDSVAAGSRAAAETVSRGTREATGRLAEGSRLAMDRLAEESRLRSERLAAASRAAAERLAAHSRETAARIGSVVRTAATPLLPVPTSAAAIVPEDEIERIDLEPLSPAALAEIAARVIPEPDPVPFPSEFPPEMVEAPAAPVAAEVGVESEAYLAADGPAMEPTASPEPALWEDPDRVVEMEIDGDFSFPMELSVGGTFLVTESGRATADISTVHAVVFGRFEGTLRASRSIRIGPDARVEGTLESPEIEIADGAVVNGLRAGEQAPDPAPPIDLPAPRSSEGEGAKEEDEIFVASPIFVEGVSRG